MMNFRTLTNYESDDPKLPIGSWYSDTNKGTKPILCLDFDGVINSYASGWCEAYFIPDPPVDGAMEFLVDASQHFTLVVFSSRSHQPGGSFAMAAYIDYWLRKKLHSDHNDPKFTNKHAAANGVRNSILFATQKPSAMITLDDRAVTFTGTWPTMEALRGFKPWNKK